jgi:hypothetical protein
MNAIENHNRSCSTIGGNKCDCHVSEMVKALNKISKQAHRKRKDTCPACIAEEALKYSEDSGL